jgi:hypothetical protein
MAAMKIPMRLKNRPIQNPSVNSPPRLAHTNPAIRAGTVLKAKKMAPQRNRAAMLLSFGAPFG